MSVRGQLVSKQTTMSPSHTQQLAPRVCIIENLDVLASVGLDLGLTVQTKGAALAKGFICMMSFSDNSNLS